MSQTAIPFHFLRGGTSRGPYFRADDLPADRDAIARILVAVLGAGHPRTIDGLGGGVAVTTKVAILSRSDDPEADVDYLFAQVGVAEATVDWAPTCGNILVGVGPAALEMGLVEAAGDETVVRIRAVNTGALVHATVRTPGGAVDYAGDVAIDGVPGTAAPVDLMFREVVGSRTGALFPSGQAMEAIDGVPVTLCDVAMPMMILRAADVGLEGDETVEALDAAGDVLARIEALRLEAGRRMGLGDVSKSVVPKVGLISAPADGGHLRVRYLMPWEAHPSLAVTGSQCLAACGLAPGTVAEGLARPHDGGPYRLEHPAGTMEVVVEYGTEPFEFRSAGVTRTARLIARGEVMVPEEAMA